MTCSVTISGDSANVTLDSNVNGTFRCSLDGKDPEICKEFMETIINNLSCRFSC